MRHLPCRPKDRQMPPAPNPWDPARLDLDRAVPYFDYFITRLGPPPPRLFGAHAPRMEVLVKAGTWTVYKKK